MYIDLWLPAHTARETTFGFPPIPHARQGNDSLGIARLFTNRGERDRAEPLGRHPIDQELQIDVVLWQVHEVRLVKDRVELSRQVGCILCPCPKGHESADIAEHRCAQGRVELI